MRPRIDTTDAMTFLNWLAPGGSFVLVSCKGHDPIEARLCNAAEAPRFLANHTRRGRIVRVLLGEPAPGFHCSRTVPKIERAHYVSLATSIARFKELDAAAKPSIWITAQDHAIAAWRLSLPATGDETFTAISAFGLEFGGKILPDMIPVPDLGNGFERHSFRFDRDAIVWKGKIQFARAAAPKKTAASEGDRLAQALSDFKVLATVTGAHVGPVITRYDLKLAKGTKIASVAQVAKDVAREMSCESARVVDGSKNGTIGIELPNKNREIVALQEVLDSPAFKNAKAALPLALGKDIGGAPVVADLADMPHLLLAGATGKGKSVGVNVDIVSLVRSRTPSQVNFIMIDPKMLELSAYASIPHMIAPVIVEQEKAVAALEWCVKEMRRRYKVLSKASVIDLAEYNATASGERMPRLVVIVDELAELTAGKLSAPVGSALQRLAQMGRACGIHLIVATQRPSVDVISGVIKANFPSRIAFQVATDADSRVIIDENGAEELLGKGDSLYLSAGGTVTRVHGAFVSRDEVRRAVKEVKDRFGPPQYRDELVALLGDEDEDGETVISRSSTRRDARLDVYKTLTVPMQRAVCFLMTIFQSRLPMSSDRVLEAGKPLGIKDGGTLYRACDLLQIERRTNGNTHAVWFPPQEWPTGFPQDMP